MQQDFDDTQSRLELALFVVKAAGAIVLRSYQDASLAIELKKDRTVVTQADRASEQYLRQAILDTFPQDRVVGEEFGVTEGESGWTWYLDPIDGTQAYARGVPLFGTLIGVEYKGESRLGVIFMPALGELLFASKGRGCHWQKGMRFDGVGFSQVGTLPAHVSKTSSLDEAMFCTTWLQSFKSSNTLPVFYRLSDAIGVFRGWGDCYGYLLVATGRADIMVDPELQIWDSAPMQVILEEAGGCYTTFQGKPDIHGGSGVATNGVLHQRVLDLISG